MRKYLTLGLLLAMLATFGCSTTKPVTSNPPTVGYAAWANAQLYVAKTTLHDNHTWELCDADGWPSTVTLDQTTELCSKFQKVAYPAKKQLKTAVDAYNIAEGAYQAYKATANGDTTALQNALQQLLTEVSALATKTGGQ